jgi:hypothetical protein
MKAWFPDLVEIDDYYIDPDTYIAEWEGRSRCLSAALAYAAIGWHVFPAPPGAKMSLKAARFSDGRWWGSTTDADEVRRDYRNWPGANLCVATGPDSGIFVVEADTPAGHGVDGIGALRALEDQHGDLPETLTAVSPSGSLHYYFRWPEGVEIRNTTAHVDAGRDLRGEGGMVLAPPSVKPRVGSYVWISKVPPANAPEWLIALAVERQGRNGERVPQRGAGRR